MIQMDDIMFDSDIASEFGNAEGPGLFGIPWFDGPSLWVMLMRFALNLVVCWIIVGCLYYKRVSAATTISLLCCSVSRSSS